MTKCQALFTTASLVAAVTLPTWQGFAVGAILAGVAAYLGARATDARVAEIASGRAGE